MRLHVGCAMWTHKPWQGRFLPPDGRLAAYATWCNAVEGNTTFYATPARATVETWARQTDSGFRFVVKLPKTITHARRLTDADRDLHAFLDAVEPLGPRLHALWLQLPGSFGPADIDVLSRFLRRLPHHYGYAVEVRDRSFFDDPAPLEDALASIGAEWIPFDTSVFFNRPPTSDAERDAWTKKPRMPRRMSALTARPIIRYLGRDSIQDTVDGWQPWVGTVTAWLREGREPTIFIHTPDNAEALALARRFHDEVRVRVPELEPLPAPIPAHPPTLF